MESIVARTIFPIFLLIAAGYISRWAGWMKQGDERVLSAYIYYFALPALFIADISDTVFTPQIIKYSIFAGLPIIVMLCLYMAFIVIFRVKRNTFYLLTVSSAFGSSAFFGVPFMIFAFPNESVEKLAVLAAAAISVVGVISVIGVLELYKLRQMNESVFIKVAGKLLNNLLRNPLILSIAAGIILSLFNIAIPAPLNLAMHMLGRTTATVAIFMLGMFLFGRKYSNIPQAFGLSILRIMLLPLIAYWIMSFSGLPKTESSILILMHAMPVAISLFVLSDRYDFEKQTIASLILVSSLGAAIYLNLWMIVLGLI